MGYFIYDHINSCFLRLPLLQLNEWYDCKMTVTILCHYRLPVPSYHIFSEYQVLDNNFDSNHKYNVPYRYDLF